MSAQRRLTEFFRQAHVLETKIQDVQWLRENNGKFVYINGNDILFAETEEEAFALSDQCNELASFVTQIGRKKAQYTLLGEVPFVYGNPDDWDEESN